MGLPLETVRGGFYSDTTSNPSPRFLYVMEIKLPHRNRGKQSDEAKDRYYNDLVNFAETIKEINSRLDFKVSSRGWCYLLEEYGLNKGDFNKAQFIINECRKEGFLPIDICAEDETRLSENILELDNDNIKDYATEWVEYLKNSVSYHYRPIHPADYQDYYIEIIVEKIDLKGLFEPVCKKYHIPYANNKGWADLNSRAALMRRFEQWENKGKTCILLYCGDHDPGGINISGALHKNLKDLENATGWNPDSLIVDRFGLNYDFIIEQNLTWVDNLETGSGEDLSSPKKKNGKPNLEHFKPYVQDYIRQYGPRKCEANALVVRTEAARKLCEDAILKYYDTDSMDKYNHDLNIQRQLVQNEIIRQMTN